MRSRAMLTEVFGLNKEYCIDKYDARFDFMLNN